MLGFLAQNGFSNVTGIDISSDQVAEAQARGFNAIEANALTYLRKHKNAYDVIIAMDIIEHFHKEELFDLLSLIFQALKAWRLVCDSNAQRRRFAAKLCNLRRPYSFHDTLPTISEPDFNFYRICQY